MRPEEQLLSGTARQRLDEDALERVAAICRARELDWERFRELACRHDVAPLVFARLSEVGQGVTGMPAATSTLFQRHRLEAWATYQRLCENVRRVLAACRAHGVETMLVKGAAIGQRVYDEPWSTPSRDADMMARGRIADYALPVRADVSSAVRAVEGIEWEWGAHHDIDMNGILPISFAAIWKAAEPLDFQGQPAFVMSIEDMLITASVQCCRRRFRRLKNLVDVGEIVDRFPRIDWTRVAERSCDQQCNYIVFAALKALSRRLDRAVPEEVLQMLRVPRSRQLLIARLVDAVSFRSPGQTSFTMASLFGLLLPYSTYRPEQFWRHLQLLRRGGRSARHAARLRASRDLRGGRPRKAAGRPGGRPA